MNNIYIKLAFTGLLLLVVILPSMAQGGPPATPIDGGLSLLLAAGGVYGMKKIRDARRK